MAPAEERYGYSVARLRAMENRLLDEAFFQRMADCDDLDSAIKVLGETVYAPWIMELKSNEDFDLALGSELCHVYDEVSRFAPDKELVQACRLPYDFHNVKVLVKSLILTRQGGERRYDLLTSLGNIDTDSLVLAVESEEYRLLPYGLHKIIPRVMALWDQNHDMLEIECLLDDALFHAMTVLLKPLSMDTIDLWLKRRIDAENLRTLVRLQRIGADASMAGSFLHKGGSISADRMISTLSEPVESWSRVLAFSHIASVLEKLQEGSDTDSLLMVFDAALDNYVTAILRSAKYDSFEPENLLRFLWLKEMEVKNLRVLLVSIANDADREMVRRLMRDVG